MGRKNEDRREGEGMTREGGREHDKGGRERAGQEGGEIERGNRGRRKERERDGEGVEEGKKRDLEVEEVLCQHHCTAWGLSDCDRTCMSMWHYSTVCKLVPF